MPALHSATLPRELEPAESVTYCAKWEGSPGWPASAESAQQPPQDLVACSPSAAAFALMAAAQEAREPEEDIVGVTDPATGATRVYVVRSSPAVIGEVYELQPDAIALWEQAKTCRASYDADNGRQEALKREILTRTVPTPVLVVSVCQSAPAVTDDGLRGSRG